MNNFKPYPKYKDSGVPWVGKIPKEWKMKKLKHVFSEKKITHDPTLPCGSISFGKVIEKPDEKIPISTKASYQVLNKGEFLINPLNLNYDVKSLRIGLSNKDVVVSSGYIVLKVQIANKRYLNYMMHRYDVAHMKLLGSGVRQTINFNHIANSLLPVPPLNEQIAIANFLDDKVGKIDAAIAQKEQLIQLLNERRQITIQNAVTKGLNPKAPMRDSGIEWIGQIPAHWEVKRLKHLFFEKNQRTTTGKETLFSLRMHAGLVPHDSVSDKPISNEQLIDYKIVEPNQIVMNRMRASIGIFGITKAAGLVSPDYAVFDSSTDVCNVYFLNLFKTDYMCTQFRLSSKGLGTGDQGFMRLYSDTFGRIPVAIPPVKEQENISTFINEQKVKFEQGIENVQSIIQKLKEYKATLINSAVTGKINVSSYDSSNAE